MSIAVVTSCSAKGYAEYGTRFVSSFLRYWRATAINPDLELHVVSEDEIPRPYIPLQESERWQQFDAINRANTRAQGKGPHPAAPHGYKIKNGYDFRCDAVKFAKKVFAIELVALQVKRGRLFWIDADVVTFAPVQRELLEKVLPSSAALSCLDRGHYHSECGFVGYNLDHPATLPFIQAFADLYLSGDVFKLKEWHDSWVFDWLRKRRSVPTFAIPHASRRHPFINSELGRYMDHCKGPRKDAGRTPQGEQLVHKAVPYWKASEHA